MAVISCSLSYCVYIFNLWMLAFNTTEGQTLNKLGNICSMTVILCSLSYCVYIFNLWTSAFNTTEDFKQNTKKKKQIILNMPLHFSHNTDYEFSVHLCKCITVTLHWNVVTTARTHRTHTVSRGSFTVKLMKLKPQGPRPLPRLWAQPYINIHFNTGFCISNIVFVFF